METGALPRRISALVAGMPIMHYGNCIARHDRQAGGFAGVGGRDRQGFSLQIRSMVVWLECADMLRRRVLYHSFELFGLIV